MAISRKPEKPAVDPKKALEQLQNLPGLSGPGSGGLGVPGSLGGPPPGLGGAPNFGGPPTLGTPPTIGTPPVAPPEPPKQQ
jgi:hypothetical protein